MIYETICQLWIKSDFHNGFLQHHQAHLPPKTFRYKRSDLSNQSFFDGIESELKSDPQALLKVLLGDYFYPNVQYWIAIKSVQIGNLNHFLKL